MIEPRLVKIAVVQIVTAGVLIAAIFALYGSYAEGRAEKQARQFCESVTPGMEAESLLKLALSAGADKMQTRWIHLENSPDRLPATFTGIFPLSRHICSISAHDGRVTTANYNYLD